MVHGPREDPVATPVEGAMNRRLYRDGDPKIKTQTDNGYQITDNGIPLQSDNGYRITDTPKTKRLSSYL